jgi:pre-mRNA-splicing factor ISY1
MSEVVYNSMLIIRDAEWAEAYLVLRGTLGLPTDDPIPKIPRLGTVLHPVPKASTKAAPDKRASKSKRKKVSEPEPDVEMANPETDESAKRSKLQQSNSSPNSDTVSETTLEHARAAASYIPFLDTENLLPPKLPSREEMEGVLLDLRKKALVEEYFGDGQQ